ncbi:MULTISPECIES: hypothetical protein [unclassified Paenibacillus]|uniref:hypothetical protein n=1 Tax=unclassified Paenibacillus TaxID=185978 RepID=UPI0024772949|nr:MULTISPECIES: hypothetical protein [unclassified Paenibacillus]MDH6431125.1 cytoskeletal protein RodZ [Paenibacillus sp. PastH-4]MDH6447220.1 cytoskeletal protein RodZ [Paenibacillus sp. PastF-4]MDH6531338.1 cytoskeletal protein RodZ [Paenibacillus sp. PastH-3]
MFNKRWKKILLWTLSVIVVLGVGGLFAANYAVDKLMNSMADGFDLESEDNVGGQDQGTAPTDTVDDSNVEPVESAVPTTPPANDEGSSNQSSENNDKPSGETTASTTSEPTKAPSSDKEGSSDGYTAQVSTDKAKQIQENVTIKDKADVASIVLGQLSVSDINHLKELAKGGLTLEEKKEARSIILGKVSEEQYNELSQIAKKYGVSQGKTYDQIKGKEKGSE